MSNRQTHEVRNESCPFTCPYSGALGASVQHGVFLTFFQLYMRWVGNWPSPQRIKDHPSPSLARLWFF